eukprot:6176191-Pleurochrysis_carterae.AAC.2
MAPPKRAERLAASATIKSNTSVAVTYAAPPVNTPSPLPPTPKWPSARPVRRNKVRCSLDYVFVQTFVHIAQVSSLVKRVFGLHSDGAHVAEYIWTEIGKNVSDPKKQRERHRAIIEKLNSTPLIRHQSCAGKQSRLIRRIGVLIGYFFHYWVIAESVLFSGTTPSSSWGYSVTSTTWRWHT